MRREFDDTLEHFPEYNRDDRDATRDARGNKIAYALGGFGALGNPASFHNPFVRKLRQWAMTAAVDGVFSSYVQLYHDDNTRLEALFDRMMFRPKGAAPSAESWHRDVTPKEYLHEDDEVFGGWLNLDSENQYFSYVPESHKGVDARMLKPKFAALKRYTNAKSKTETEDWRDAEAKRTRFVVKPGYLVIFPQHIVHEVVADKAKRDMYRLFMGWRLTRDQRSMFDVTSVIAQQGVPRLPSNQEPPMYSLNHQSFFLNRPFQPRPDANKENEKVTLIQWCQNTFRPQLLTRNLDGERGLLLPRSLRSLREYNMQLYPDYTSAEINMFTPNVVWRLLEPGRARVARTVSLYAEDD